MAVVILLNPVHTTQFAHGVFTMAGKRTNAASEVSVCALTAFTVCIGGCAVETKQTQLPSPSYLQDDVSYMPVGPEAIRKAASEEERRKANAEDLPSESDVQISLQE